jgi:hypothetical protein
MRFSAAAISARFAVLLCTLCAVTPARAWNNLGHKVVAEIAWQQLDPPTRQKIVDTFRRHPRFQTDFVDKMEDAAGGGDKDVQDHWVFQHAATWPDEIRKNKEYDRPAWHYINLPLHADSTGKVIASKLMKALSGRPDRNRRDQYNILQALAANESIIRSKADAGTKAIAYCWVLHLVGDIHQPLHSTALYDEAVFPKGDEGGNKIPLTKGKNLHSVWDGLLGRQYYMRNVDKVVKELSNRDHFGEIWNTAGAMKQTRRSGRTRVTFGLFSRPHQDSGVASSHDFMAETATTGCYRPESISCLTTAPGRYSLS